jgi:tetratricopeptide (TPR) repeat protein
MIELLAGEPEAAERELRADYQTLEQMGETYFLSTMTALLARAVRDQGRDAEALELTKTAEAMAADDDIDAQASWRFIRAPIVARLGALEEAEGLARSALELSLKTEVPILQADALYELSCVLQLSGRLQEAREALRQARAQYRDKGDLVSVSRTTSAMQRLDL